MKKSKIFSALLVSSSLLINSSCSEADERLGFEKLGEDILPAAVSGKAADENFISAQTDFAVKLFQSGEFTENTLVSPLSVTLALAMTANGACGETKAQTEKLLGGDLTMEQLNEYLYYYMQNIPDDESFKLTSCNSIWLRDTDNLSVNKSFLQTNRNYYSADIYKAPFDESTVNEINKWVKNATDGMIGGIIDEIPPSAMLYLINALAFDAKWEEPYEKYQISDGEFHALGGETQDVKMLRGSERAYLDDGKATGFIKNYCGGYSFAALLPNEDISIEDYINSMTGEEFLNTINNASQETVITKMPKFEFSYSASLEKDLAQLGMTYAFDSEKADFTEMARSTVQNIYINRVLHKTFISVDELGTKAGAVTAIEMTDAAAPVDEQPPKYVTLDRPFVFAIINDETGLPVFMGALLTIDS